MSLSITKQTSYSLQTSQGGGGDLLLGEHLPQTFPKCYNKAIYIVVVNIFMRGTGAAYTKRQNNRTWAFVILVGCLCHEHWWWRAMAVLVPNWAAFRLPTRWWTLSSLVRRILGMLFIFVFPVSCVRDIQFLRDGRFNVTNCNSDRQHCFWFLLKILL